MGVCNCMRYNFCCVTFSEVKVNCFRPYIKSKQVFVNFITSMKFIAQKSAVFCYFANQKNIKLKQSAGNSNCKSRPRSKPGLRRGLSQFRVVHSSQLHYIAADGKQWYLLWRHAEPFVSWALNPRHIFGGGGGGGGKLGGLDQASSLLSAHCSLFPNVSSSPQVLCDPLVVGL